MIGTVVREYPTVDEIGRISGLGDVVQGEDERADGQRVIMICVEKRAHVTLLVNDEDMSTAKLFGEIVVCNKSCEEELDLPPDIEEQITRFLQ